MSAEPHPMTIAARAGRANPSPLPDADWVTLVAACLPLETSPEAAVTACTMILSRFNCCEEHLIPVLTDICHALTLSRVKTQRLTNAPEGRPN